MTRRRFFAVGTRPPVEPSETEYLIADALLHMLAHRNKDGTWGGPDNLDRFITTCHVVMTLMAAGVAPTSSTLRPALDFLSHLDTQRQTTFYWRSGPLLNVEGYEEIVAHDAQYLARVKGRASGNPDYPAPFFLLKLIRFYEGPLALGASLDETVGWVLGEWSDEECWYGRTSITSMGLALLADVEDVKASLLDRAIQFLIQKYGPRPDGRQGFSDNVIDDAFTVYNLYERWDVLENRLPAELWTCVSGCADGIKSELRQLKDLPPPFGGSVDSPEYARAVLARAVMARQLAVKSDFEASLAVALTSERAERLITSLEGARTLEPFWGPSEVASDGECFVLMPFSSPRRNEIYEHYIKKPLEDELGITCKRADDMYESKSIMGDVWHSINHASLVIADLSDRNPNVFYELGLAHVVGKPVILVAEREEDIPFDLRPIRTILYGNQPSTWSRLASQVVAYARSILE